jgi:hypothetical protein
MDDFENLLASSLREGPRPDAGRGEIARKEALRMFENKILIVKVLTWIAIAVSLGLMIGGAVAISGGKIDGMLIGLLFFYVGVELQLLMKLWFWIVHSRITIQKDLKELEMRLMERLPPAAEK